MPCKYCIKAKAGISETFSINFISELLYEYNWGINLSELSSDF